jgi:hypothetical protein
MDTYEQRRIKYPCLPVLIGGASKTQIDTLHEVHWLFPVYIIQKIYRIILLPDTGNIVLLTKYFNATDLLNKILRNCADTSLALFSFRLSNEKFYQKNCDEGYGVQKILFTFIHH